MHALQCLARVTNMKRPVTLKKQINLANGHQWLLAAVSILFSMSLYTASALAKPSS